MWGVTIEDIQAWMAASNQQTEATTPVLVVNEKIRCDSCKRFISSLETVVMQSNLYCHITEKCLPKFAEKHYWDSINMCKKVQLVSDGDI